MVLRKNLENTSGLWVSFFFQLILLVPFIIVFCDKIFYSIFKDIGFTDFFTDLLNMKSIII